MALLGEERRLWSSCLLRVTMEKQIHKSGYLMNPAFCWARNVGQEADNFCANMQILREHNTSSFQFGSRSEQFRCMNFSLRLQSQGHAHFHQTSQKSHRTHYTNRACTPSPRHPRLFFGPRVEPLTRYCKTGIASPNDPEMDLGLLPRTSRLLLNLLPGLRRLVDSCSICFICNHK